MISNKSNSIRIGCLLSLFLSTVAGIGIIIRYQQMTSCYNNRPPLREFVVNINTDQSQELIEQSRKFANKHGFRFQIAYYTPDGIDFSIWMERKDVEVIARSPFTPGEFEIGFYNYDCINPTVASDIDGLVSDLKSLVIEIPSATITDEK
jgi:hypothetical protein